MRYAETRYRQHQRDVAYRIYLADNLRIIGENTAKAVSISGRGEIAGTYIKARASSLFGYDEESDVDDNMTGDDVFNDLLKHLGLEVNDE